MEHAKREIPENAQMAGPGIYARSQYLYVIHTAIQTQVLALLAMYVSEQRVTLATTVLPTILFQRVTIETKMERELVQLSEIAVSSGVVINVTYLDNHVLNIVPCLSDIEMKIYEHASLDSLGMIEQQLLQSHIAMDDSAMEPAMVKHVTVMKAMPDSTANNTCDMKAAQTVLLI